MNLVNILKLNHISEFRDWLKKHSQQEKECWLALSRKTNSKEIYYINAVYEAIAFGWIDSTLKNIDGISYQRFSPRAKRSPWTELNKERARYLIRNYLMTEAGFKTLPNLDEAFVINDVIIDRIKEDLEVYKNFKQFPELYIKVRVDNIQRMEKYQDVFHSRLEKFIENTKKGIMFGEWNDKGKLL